MREGATLVAGHRGDLPVPGASASQLLPMSDDPVRTRLRSPGPGEVDFQEYFVKLRHSVAVEAVRFAGAEAVEAGARAC